MKVIARGLPVYLHPSLGYNNTRDYLVMRWNFYRKNDSFISTINEINLDLVVILQFNVFPVPTHFKSETKFSY